MSILADILKVVAGLIGLRKGIKVDKLPPPPKNPRLAR